jgi:hypothetical protein
MAYDSKVKNPAVSALLGGTAPQQLKIAAARGLLPLPQDDLIEVLVSIAESSDAELAKTASGTIAAQDAAAVETLVRADSLSPKTLGHLTRRAALPNSLYEALVTNAATPAEAIVDFARTTTSGSVLEFITLNQQLLIQTPELIDALLSNPHRTFEAERRVLETKREFFEKERGAQQIANELRAQGKDAAAEFIENAEFASDLGSSGLSDDDAIFIASHIESFDRETDDSWLGLEYIEEFYEETVAQRKAAFEKILGEWQAEENGELSGERISMLNRIMKMGVKDRMKLAMKGDREARNILIRDPNRLVCTAVANNPRITEQEVETIATMRSVPEDILRQIASHRQWQRSYTIMHNLVKNPRTPLANSMTIMNKMQIRDLVALSKNKNVPEAVRRHALRLANARTGNK